MNIVYPPEEESDTARLTMEETNNLIRREVRRRGSAMTHSCDGICTEIVVTAGRENTSDAHNKRLSRGIGVEGCDSCHTYHVIWDDGTRELMKPILVNEDETRGWFAKRGDTVQFTHPITSLRVMDFHHKTAVRGWISWRVKLGQPFYRERSYVWNVLSREHEEQEQVLRLLSVDATEIWDHLAGMAEIIDKRILNAGAHNEEPTGSVQHDDVPLNKFMEDYNPCFRRWQEHPLDKEVRKAMLNEVRPCSIYSKERIRWSLGLHTLWKIVKQWRKVHTAAEDKKYRPGGVGHKRAREDWQEGGGGL